MQPLSKASTNFGILPIWLLFPYFRFVASPSLHGAIGLAGLVAFLTHRSVPSLGIFALALATSYAVRNGILFWDAVRSKQEVVRLLAEYSEISLLRLPPEIFARYFDLEMLVPSFIRPSWLVSHLARDRVHVFLAKRTSAAAVFPSSIAFVSPIAQDCYIFLRSDPRESSPIELFRMGHELGHATAIFTGQSQRDLIGMICVYASIAWLAANSIWSPLFIGWTIAEGLAAVVVGHLTLARTAGRKRLNAEIAADYTAFRNLPSDALAKLLDDFETDELIESDSALTPEQNSIRRTIAAEQAARLRSGQEIDIPAFFMRETFKHPLLLVLFVFAHFCYVSYFAATNDFSVACVAICVVPALLFILLGARKDAICRVKIDKITPSA
jgi:hypothetical protein